MTLAVPATDPANLFLGCASLDDLNCADLKSPPHLMTSFTRKLKLTLALALAGVSLLEISISASTEQSPTQTRAESLQQFSPSNARTEGGKPIPADQFFPAARCASCHKESHAEWSESLHRNAGREPFYKESVALLERARGGVPAQHCEACHAPVAVLSGELQAGRGGGQSHAMEDEGVSCAVCHSITEVRLDGTGSYTMRRPALLARTDGTPVTGNVSDAEIMADVAGHRRAVMRPLLKQPEFCAACHKSVATPELNQYKFLRGFSAYDEWQQSGASGEAVMPYYRREQRLSCNSCHMPRVDGQGDLGAKEGTIASHRWLGANTAAPLFYGQQRQLEMTESFLQSNVLSLDIFAIKSGTEGKLLGPLNAQGANPIALKPGEEVTVEVVVANRKAAHSFPPELRDMYEPWVEFEALDQSGQTIYHSGFIKPDQTLDESAHVYKSILLDESGRAITRHQMWLARVKAYDNAIPSGRSDIARYHFRVPANVRTGAFISLTLRARLNYRRFIQEYTSYVLQQRRVLSLNIPVVQMAAAEVKIVAPRAPASNRTAPGGNGASRTPELQALRWNDYGIGLLEQAQYGPASEAFRRASQLNPNDPDPLVSAAVAEMRTERYGPERDQLRKASLLLDEALKLAPRLARTRFVHALLLRSEGKQSEASEELIGIACEYPRDREVQRQLGQTLYAMGRVEEARVAFESILTIDPNDTGAYQFLAPIYLSEGRTSEAARARSLYLLWRDDPLADRVAVRFFNANPQWAEERVLMHTHGEDSPSRPTLTGHFAAPED
jgi:Flp pilus assembly protein TadD